MDFHFLKIPGFKIDTKIFENEIKSISEIKSVKFIKIYIKKTEQSERHDFYTLNSLIKYGSDNDGSYNFIEIELKDGRSLFKFIYLNKASKAIVFYSNYGNSHKNWRIFFNSKNSVVIDSPSHRTDYIKLYDNKYYKGIDFYVGIASLVDIISNAPVNKPFEEIAPMMKSERMRLSNPKIIIHDDDFSERIYTNESIDNSALDNNNKIKISLEHLIGLDNVKQEIKALKSLAMIRAKKIGQGIPVSPSTLHMVFTGNPGTGKTTVARLIGEIYHDIGILKGGHLVEVTSGELEGKYVGHTAPKTKEYFDKAIDGVLFIDEAYSLLKTGNNFGKEVIDTLMKLMEDNRESVVVIIAGYPKEIDDLLNANTGLKERFSTFINFEDYSKSQLKEIFLKMVSDLKHKLSKGASYKFDYLLDECFEVGYFKSNARTVRNIFENMQKHQSIRLSKMKSTTNEDLITFLDVDLPDKLC